MLRAGRREVPRRKEIRYKFLWPEAETSVETEAQMLRTFHDRIGRGMTTAV
jgi:hypothetical protein